MRMWYILLGITIVLTIACLIYIGWRVSGFGFIKQIANHKYRWLCSLLLVCAIFGILALSLNMMNAVICLLHICGFWIICDIAFLAIGHWHPAPFAHYYAGIAAIALSVLYLGCGVYLDYHIFTTSYQLKSPKIKKPLRVVMFADSHIGTTFDGEGFARHMQKIQAQNPDVVLLVGDYVDDGSQLKEMQIATKALGELKTQYGVYFVFGNHDKGYYNSIVRGYDGNVLQAELQKNGVRVLEDEAVPLRDDILLLGRKDSSEFFRGGSRKSMRALTKDLPQNRFVVVMDHQPNDYEKQAAAGVDLVVSGHTHGGQMFPLNKVGEWIGANDNTYGLDHRRQTDFIVTSGLSDWAIKIKTGTKSEFVVIDLLPE